MPVFSSHASRAALVCAAGLSACGAEPAPPADSVPAAAVPGAPSAGVSSAPEPAAERTAAPPRQHTAEVIAEFPHDPEAFTQGLIYRDGRFFESTGGYGTSTVRITDAATGEVLQRRALPDTMFGEGIELVDGQLVGLTWRSGVAFVMDPETLEVRRAQDYRGEGWGLAYDGTRLIMSDGSATLRFLDPRTLRQTGTLGVTAQGVPISRLNELEFHDGRLLANLFQDPRIVAIDPQSGEVTDVYDLSALVPEEHRGSADNVLNGIAVDPETGRTFVTGKRWDVVYEVEWVPAAPAVPPAP